jgi:hypothetical protein
MKQKSDLTAEDGVAAQRATSPPRQEPEQDSRDGAQAKRALLTSKCQDLLESVPSYEELYDQVLAALAASHRQDLSSLQAELIQLNTAIPKLEKKSIKRLKLAGTLTWIEKQSQKIKSKASQKRKKDLYRMDDFIGDALRTLRALNQKISAR